MISTMIQPISVSEAFSTAVEASFAHMRRSGRTVRNQDDYDAGVKMLVELSHVGQIGGKL
jgi:hypothetical protein